MQPYAEMERLTQSILSESSTLTNEELAVMITNAITTYGPWILGFLGVCLLLGLMLIAAHWCIFRKAGTGGWKSLIPIYCDYTLIKISWKKKYFWFMVLLMIASAVLSELAFVYTQHMLLFSLADLAVVLILLVLAIKAEVKLAKAFGKGGGFAVGLIFLPVIFYPILGFGKAKFRRRKKRRKKAQPAQA